MGKYDHIYNRNLVDLVNEQIDIDKLWNALYECDRTDISIGFFYVDGTNSVYKYERYFYERYFMDTIYFTDDLSVDITHDRLLSIKFNHKEMVFDSLATLESLESIVMINMYRPTEYIFKLDVQNYTPIQGTKVINWS